MESKYELNTSELIFRLSNADLLVNAGRLPQTVTGVTADSRKVTEGMLFICKGFGFKPEYLTKALDAGACAYISEETYAVGAPCLQVRDVRKASSLAAAWANGDPAGKFTLIGITGTKGKTTTANILKTIFDEAEEEKTALISTGSADTLQNKYDTHLTTPEPVELQQYFGEAAEAGAGQLVMEVSSQAMKLSRVYGVRFDYGIFLNVDEDHIGGKEHPTLEDYVECKTDFLSLCDTVILNTKTRFYDKALAKAQLGGGRILRYGPETDCEYRLHDIRSDASGMRFCLTKDSVTTVYETNLIGAFNAENLAGAVIASLEAGVELSVLKRALMKIHVPGRMLVIPAKGFHVVVDYAHNRLSFEKLYEAVKETFKPHRILSVFGCPGERSKVRRRDMGELAEQYADEIFLTADDPGYEDLGAICDEIRGFIPTKPCHVIYDRTEAVKKALSLAGEGDVVILGGKGSETTQRVTDHYEAYAGDEAVVRKWLANL